MPAAATWAAVGDAIDTAARVDEKETETDDCSAVEEDEREERLADRLLNRPRLLMYAYYCGL